MCVFKDFLVLGNLKVSCDSFDLIFFVFYGFFLQFLLGGAGEIFPILFPLEFLRLLLNTNVLKKELNCSESIGLKAKGLRWTQKKACGTDSKPFLNPQKLNSLDFFPFL